jgi:16S rRNA (cytidine1402-2'-O)-methyltransferase
MKASRRARAAPAADPLQTPPPNPAGTLFVVATPIGNLEDITLRALRVLREVALVAAEDTRRTGNLLRHYQIATPLLSVHEHNEHARVTRILAELRNGKSIALTTDAGTPGISDPGALVVREARAAGFRVEPIPGPSAVTTALSAAGLDLQAFTFLGFPPASGAARAAWLERLSSQPRTATVFFEAPHRIGRLLKELALILGNHQIMLARELTKRFEEWIEATPAEISTKLQDVKGEFVIIIPPQQDAANERQPPSDTDVAVLFGQITDFNAASRRDAIRQVATATGLSPKAVYAALERVKTR